MSPIAKCNCNSQTCGCKITAGEGVAVSGSGTPKDPFVISSGGGGEGASGWEAGDLKDTVASTTPAGWLECDGQAINRAAYAALFSAIGTTWGAGDGVNTFNVPNLVGRFKVGAGAGYPLASSGGTANTVLGIDNLPIHSHSMAHTHVMSHGHGNTGTASSNHTHTFQFQYLVNTDTTGSGGAPRVSDINDQTGGVGTGANGTTSAAGADHVHGVADFNGNTGGSSTPNTGLAGAGASFSNLPPYRAVRVLIKT